MNENEIDRITAAINVLRPDWPATSLKTLLGKHELKVRPRRDVAVALAWVACESASKTPARVLEAGPWWIAAAAEGNKVRTSYNQPCTVHAGEILPCGRCANEAVPAVRTDALQQARAELLSAVARLCPAHGVPETHCRGAHPAHPAKPADSRESHETAPTEETA